jgi:ferredoxin, 2Fe-2S
MFDVVFMPEKRSVRVTRGTNLMSAILQADLPIGSSCGAAGICARCFVKVIEGMENLSKPNANERRLLEREKFGENIRISCLTKVLGPVKITTSYW